MVVSPGWMRMAVALDLAERAARNLLERKS
jgi:hypothetical protein